MVSELAQAKYVIPVLKSKFPVVVFQRMAKKYEKIQNACTEPLFCSINLLFGEAFASVAIVVP